LKKRIVKKITETAISKKDFNELFQPLELTLLQSNVAVKTIEVVKESLSKELVGKSVKRGSLEQAVTSALKKSISNVLVEGDVKDLISEIKASKEPVSIMFVGANGSGKTTTIAKIAKFLKSQKISVVLAACDTFRAASIEQLETHGRALGVKVVKHSYGSDAAAVAYDALEHAKANNIKVVLIDTAGRSHSNVNLMRELEKVKRVVNPDYTIFVGDALTGNDVVLQAKDFNDVTPFDYVILTKTDVDEKGGAILSVSHETGAPVLFLGTGQTYADLEPFNKKGLVKQLL
ncbi:signal recognition particle-docking protein FtsY, partial [archaeon]|nr:signal recognition particle-docking protein FtsY [archaeon]